MNLDNNGSLGRNINIDHLIPLLHSHKYSEQLINRSRFTLLSNTLFNGRPRLPVYFSTLHPRHPQLDRLSKIFSKSKYQSAKIQYQTLSNTYSPISTQTVLRNALLIPHNPHHSEGHLSRWLCRALREKFRI